MSQQYSMAHQNDIRTGDSVQMDASSSCRRTAPTHSWDCDGDGATDKPAKSLMQLGIRHIQRNIDRSIRQ